MIIIDSIDWLNIKFDKITVGHNHRSHEFAV